jgi:PAS domain S-box-containing protein
MADAERTVLLVEDEALIALGETERLRECGYSVSHALTGERAIEIVESNPDGIWMILMDIDLGKGMDGTEAARRILERFDLPVLFISSHGEREIVAGTEGVTNYGYLLKSSSFTVIDASIKMARKLFEARKRIGANELERMERDLQASEERYKSIASVSGIGAWEYHRDTGFLWCSPEYFTMLGRDPEDFRMDGGPNMERAWIELLHPEDRERSSKLFADYLDSGATGLYENQSRMKHRDGRWVWILSRARRIGDRDGRPTDVTRGVHIDITERMLFEEMIQSLLGEKELILKEVHHRVKNNLGTVVGLLSVQAGERCDPVSADILMETAGRVESMALLYEKLFESKNVRALSLREYLTSLVGEIVSIFPDRSKVATEIDIPEIVLEAKTLSPLGIIVNELVTNAMKYAFEGRPGGKISLRARKSGDRISLLFRDDGIGLPEGGESAAPKGFGLELVEMMARQLDGSLKVESGGGTAYTLEFPA